MTFSGVVPMPGKFNIVLGGVDMVSDTTEEEFRSADVSFEAAAKYTQEWSNITTNSSLGMVKGN